MDFKNNPNSTLVGWSITKENGKIRKSSKQMASEDES
jgi:hypothetical protein